MRPAVTVTILAWAILGALASPCQGDGFTVPIVKLSDQDVAVLDLDDVSTADWEGVIGAPTLTAADFGSVECCDFAAYDPTDLDFRVWLGWHDATNRIYCAVERADDVNLRDDLSRGLSPSTWEYGGFWMQDSIVRFDIDGDGHGGSREWFLDSHLGESEEEVSVRRDAAHRTVQWYWVLGDLEGPWRKIYLIENGFQFHASWFDEPPYAYAGGGHFGELPTVDVTEFYVTPFDLFVWDDESRSIVSELKPGGRILFQILLMDRDVAIAKHTAAHLVFSFPQITPGSEPRLAQGVLVEGPGGWESSSEALPAASWGRIKAPVSGGVGRRDP